MIALVRRSTNMMRTGCLKLAPTTVAALIACALAFGCTRRSSDSGSGLALLEGRAVAKIRESVDAGMKATPPPHAQTDLDDAEATSSKIAFAWLATLAKHDTNALLAASRIPFVLRDAGGAGHCKNAILKDADQLLPALKCLLDNATLTKVLRANSDPQGGPVPRKYLPNWAEKWTKDVGPDVYPIAIVVVGAPASFDFVILAAPDGVHGLFKHVSHEAQN